VDIDEAGADHLSAGINDSDTPALGSSSFNADMLDVVINHRDIRDTWRNSSAIDDSATADHEVVTHRQPSDACAELTLSFFEDSQRNSNKTRSDPSLAWFAVGVTAAKRRDYLGTQDLTYRDAKGSASKVIPRNQEEPALAHTDTPETIHQYPRRSGIETQSPC